VLRRALGMAASGGGAGMLPRPVAAPVVTTFKAHAFTTQVRPSSTSTSPRVTPDRMLRSYGWGRLVLVSGVLGRDAGAMSGGRHWNAAVVLRIPPQTRVSGGIPYLPRTKKVMDRTGRSSRARWCRLFHGDAAREWGCPRRDDSAMGRGVIGRTLAGWSSGQLRMQIGRKAADERQNAGGRMALGWIGGWNGVE